MKRPLFCGILSYALGLSACVTTGYGILLAGISGFLLLFAFHILHRDRYRLIHAALLLFFFAMGYIYPGIIGLRTADIESAVPEDGSEAEVAGIVHEVKETEYGVNLIVKVKVTRLEEAGEDADDSAGVGGVGSADSRAGANDAAGEGADDAAGEGADDAAGEGADDAAGKGADDAAGKGAEDGRIFKDCYKILVSVAPEVIEEYGLKPGSVLRAKGRLEQFEGQRVPGGYDKRKYYLARGVLYQLKGAEITVPEASVGGTGKTGSISRENKSQVGLGRDMEVTITPGLISRGYYGLVNALEELRGMLGDRLSDIASPVTAGILKGILLGDRSDIPEDITKLYRTGGISHILAISSLHITMISGALGVLLKVAGVPFLPAGILTLVITFAYALMTGFGFATKRAFIMLVISVVGKLLGRRYDMLTGLSLALFIMLIINPYCIYDSSLLMSAAAMFGVALGRELTNRLDRYVRRQRLPVKARVRNRVIYAFVKSVVFSVGLNIVLTPVIAYVYMEFPLYSILINLLVIPLMTLVVGVGFLALLVSLVSPVVAGVLIKPAGLILMLYDALTGLFSCLPFSVITVGGVRVSELAVYYLAVLAVVTVTGRKGLAFLAKLKLVRRRVESDTARAEGSTAGGGCGLSGGMVCRVAAIISVFIVLLGGLIIFVPRAVHKERIVVLDVGQGDGIFISTGDGVNLMIDGGSSTQENIGGRFIEPCLKYYRAKHISLWFITHADMDHVSGLLDILEDYEGLGIMIDKIVLSTTAIEDETMSELIVASEFCGIEVVRMDCFDYISTGKARITCLHPDRSFVSDDKNDRSLALLYEGTGINALFTGDMGTEAIEHMLELCDAGREEDSDESACGTEEKGDSSKGVCEIGEDNSSDGVYETGTVDIQNLDLLKIPHHGSENSLSTELYALLKPGGTAVISCARRNRYGHPHKSVMEALAGYIINVDKTWGGSLIYEE